MKLIVSIVVIMIIIGLKYKYKNKRILIMDFDYFQKIFVLIMNEILNDKDIIVCMKKMLIYLLCYIWDIL